MNGIALAASYSFITNRLKYCGPEGAHRSFLLYLEKPTKKLADEVREHISRFEGLYPYLRCIAKKHSLDPFDYRVVEAYWIGNDLLDIFSKDDLAQIIMELAQRGLPKSYAEKLCSAIPQGMVPHHSFNVLYVGVGKVTGSVPTNLENINNCLVRPGHVIEVKDLIRLWHTPLARNLAKAKNAELLAKAPHFALQKGDIVALHWNSIAGKLDQKQLENLEKYTDQNLAALRG